MESYGRQFLEMLYPTTGKCAACGREILPERGLCRRCAQQMHPTGATCATCGVESEQEICRHCKREPRYFTRAASAYCYDGIVGKLVRQFKYDGRVYLAEILTDFLLDSYIRLQSGISMPLDCILPVPASAGEWRERGFFPVGMLAKGLSRRTGIPFSGDTLVKIRETPRQMGKDKRGRAENLVDAFRAKPIHGNVLLVDDVLTTGATANECAKCLREAGASAVYVVSVVSVREKSDADAADFAIRHTIWSQRKK